MPPPVPPSVKAGLMIAGKAVAARRDRQADSLHRLAEQSSVLGHGNRASVRSDQLDSVLLEHSLLGELHCHVEGGLPAHRREQGIRLLFRDDELHVLRRHRLDVGAVGELRIGHNGRRIGVDEDDLEPFFLERLRRLRPRIVELGALPDYDRA